MHIEFIAYPFLFIAIYFEVFLLLIFLSPHGRTSRARPTATHTPRVAIIVPCWNEETTIAGTVHSLLALDYPADRLQIILVNDGSTDGTQAAMDVFQTEPRVAILHKENGGKHTAINAGMELAQDADIIGCLDADSFVAPSALREMIAYFDDSKVAAVTPAMSVLNPRTALERMQNAEYIFGIGWRHALALVNGIFVTPGPFSMYRKSVIDELGGFRYAHQAEDMEMALRMQRHGWHIENAPKARVYTKAPRNVFALIKQRTRWTTGFLRNVLLDYSDLVGNPKHKALGLMVLPFGFLAVSGGITLFVVAIYMTASQVVTTVATVSGVPLSYILTPHFSLGWFYIPVTFLILLGLVASGISITFMILGKKISETEGNLGLDMLAYCLLYGFVAPWWLLRSVIDVTFGRKRSWR
ncbi:MAG: glycosyltransferase family 2 protein [Candidatus Pacebacteria bacterium]|nr:glycosyltransferase family 2 protein [Candidatus Paceibacterota bacterium]